MMMMMSDLCRQRHHHTKNRGPNIFNGALLPGLCQLGSLFLHRVHRDVPMVISTKLTTKSPNKRIKKLTGKFLH
jgi:hypothetical protein